MGQKTTDCLLSNGTCGQPTKELILHSRVNRHTSKMEGEEHECILEHAVTGASGGKADAPEQKGY